MFSARTKPTVFRDRTQLKLIFIQRRSPAAKLTGNGENNMGTWVEIALLGDALFFKMILPSVRLFNDTDTIYDKEPHPL